MAFKRFMVSVDDKTYETIQNIVDATGDSQSEVVRKLIEKGLAKEWADSNTDLLSQIIRQQLEVVMKPHVERLAALSSKGGHMAATATFLNVQALMDLVPTDRKKDVRTMYDSARKKAVEYMKTKAEDWDVKEVTRNE